MAEAVVSIQSLRGRVLSLLDEHLARALARLGGEQRDEVLLAAALTSRFVREGHACLDLPRFLMSPGILSEGGDPIREAWPDRDAWLSALHSSPLVDVTSGSESRPLVLDEQGRLYLRRYWEHESEVAAAIRCRVEAVDSADDSEWLRATLDRLFPRNGGPSGGEVNWQRVAAAVAALRPFCVVTGGPGTGKTFTVTKILALLIERALHRGSRPPRVALLAPTGKAAARLSDAVRRAKSDLATATNVIDLIPDHAATIHRCIGVARGSATRVRHDRTNPLAADIVLVDEASMVDLALLRRLLDATPPEARVILLGDKDQLASVEAGAVLGDICNGGRPLAYSDEWRRLLCDLTGEALPPDAQAPQSAGIWDCIVQLRHGYRSERVPAIAALAAAINRGDAAESLAILTSSDNPGVTWSSEVDRHGVPAALQREIVGEFASYLRQADTPARLRRLDGFRVLCAHRRGPRGADSINVLVERLLAEQGLIDADGVYPGRPLLITQNDYQLRLFNGDLGIVVSDPEAEGRHVVVFEAEDGGERRLSLSRLPLHEVAYAMSIHKSQGSELDRVAVVLPAESSPVLSRELLYTAVTRAREAVTIHGSRDIVEDTIRRRVERWSGLRDALWKT